ncbi:MAG: hypothetical protein OXI88_03510 [Gammaproteobacteria bacterium]|nr:hypothetical protein [Gammaproteobacteria bacterium]MDE0284760.1 hypothetical protein [Gammaproteobacteria bacterium]MDE0510836.1 hypothetical protein [Gammaproteobacteria bacterium]
MNHRHIYPVCLLLILAACEQSISLKVDSEIPTPVIARMPVTMGILYRDELRNYVYEENSDERPNWKIDSGSSHIALFEQILGSMFEQTKEVAGTDSDATVDAVLAPSVAEMQFALPAETKSDFYEAWIKYDVELYNRDGSPIANWSVTGYGKSSTEFMKSRDKGLNAAVNQALRDAGARFALGFSRVEEVGAWLEQVDSSADGAD